MKKAILIFILLILLPTYSLAEDKTSSNDEIMKQQQDSLNISSFLKEAEVYTKDEFEELDMANLLNEAIKGKIDHTNLIKKILSRLGKEVKESLNVLRKYLSNHINT